MAVGSYSMSARPICLVVTDVNMAEALGAVEPEPAPAIALATAQAGERAVPLSGCATGTAHVCGLVVAVVHGVDVVGVGCPAHAGVVPLGPVTTEDSHPSELLA